MTPPKNWEKDTAYWNMVGKKKIAVGLMNEIIGSLKSGEQIFLTEIANQFQAHGLDVDDFLTGYKSFDGPPVLDFEDVFGKPMPPPR